MLSGVGEGVDIDTAISRADFNSVLGCSSNCSSRNRGGTGGENPPTNQCRKFTTRRSGSRSAMLSTFYGHFRQYFGARRSGGSGVWESEEDEPEEEDDDGRLRCSDQGSRKEAPHGEKDVDVLDRQEDEWLWCSGARML